MSNTEKPVEIEGEIDPFFKGKEKKGAKEKPKEKPPKKERRQDGIAINFTQSHNREHVEGSVEMLNDLLPRYKGRIRVAFAGRVAFALLYYMLKNGSAKSKDKIKELVDENW